jgi:transglutaminase-like putative cysteine protease
VALLHVIHETRYDYAPAVRMAQHMAHLRPRDGDGQQLIAHQLTIEPAPAERSEMRDVWGNLRTFFSLQASHEELTVLAESTVRTSAALQSPDDGAEAMPWEDVRERMRYHRDASWDPAAEFVFASPYVPRDEAFIDYARTSFSPGRSWVEAASDLMSRIHADFVYEPEATDVGTPPLEVLSHRKGVCQDFAHVMIACLRSLALPARYVSGYLLTQPPPGQPRLVGSDASHAWVSIYVPAAEGAGQWISLDPTNDRRPGEDYVVLATGRDYSDVAPLRGVLQGGAQHTLAVAVTVTPV